MFTVGYPEDSSPEDVAKHMERAIIIVDTTRPTSF